MCASVRMNTVQQVPTTAVSLFDSRWKLVEAGLHPVSCMHVSLQRMSCGVKSQGFHESLYNLTDVTSLFPFKLCPPQERNFYSPQSQHLMKWILRTPYLRYGSALKE